MRGEIEVVKTLKNIQPGAGLFVTCKASHLFPGAPVFQELECLVGYFKSTQFCLAL